MAEAVDDEGNCASDFYEWKAVLENRYEGNYQFISGDDCQN